MVIHTLLNPILSDDTPDSQGSSFSQIINLGSWDVREIMQFNLYLLFTETETEFYRVFIVDFSIYKK